MQKFFLLMAAMLLLISSCATQNHSLSLKKKSNIAYNTTFSNVNLSPYENSFLAKINQIRTKGNRCAPATTPLRKNFYLQKAAMMHAKDMALHNFLSHTGSADVTDIAKKSSGAGSSFIDRIIFFGYQVAPNHLVGENIAKTIIKKGENNTLTQHFQRALEKMLNDPVHCKILMNPRFQEIGIGVYKGNDAYYWVFDFGERI